MTEYKFTDEEIVKALEHCTSSCGSDACKGCPFGETEACYDRENIIAVESLAVINHQKAEIERLTGNMNAFALGMKAEKERADGIIDEFAERMKKALTMEYHGIKISVKAESIDKIAEEMKRGAQ